jgi:DNA-binding transcriptional LysR family regulator
MDRLRLLDGRLKMRHIVLVDALTRQGSIVGAAAALHITQPGATRTLQELEAILGVPLYERGPRGVTPTTIGEAFTGHARAVLAQLSQAGRQVTELTDPDCGTVVVGTCPVGSIMLLPQAIAGLKRERPLVTVIVRESSPEALSAELKAGRIDLIVGRFTSPTTESEVRTPLYDESIVICTRAQHPLAHRRIIAFADLGDYPWIIPSTETALRREIEELFARHAMVLPQNRIEAPSWPIVRQLLVESDFIAALPGPMELYEPGLRALPLSLGPIGHCVGITTAAGPALSPWANALIQSLQAIARERLVDESEDNMNRPGKCGGSRPWKRGWSHAEGTGAGKADFASV